MKRIFLDYVASLFLLGVFVVPFAHFISKYETISIGEVFLLAFAMVAFAAAFFVKASHKEGSFTRCTERFFSYLGVIAFLIAFVGSLFFISAVDNSKVSVGFGQGMIIWLCVLCVPLITGVTLGYIWGKRIATTI